MTFATAFYLFILPLVIAAVGAGVAYYVRGAKHRLHPGE